MNLGKKHLSLKDSRDILIELNGNSTIQEKERKEMLNFLKSAIKEEAFIIQKKRN